VNAGWWLGAAVACALCGPWGLIVVAVVACIVGLWRLAVLLVPLPPYEGTSVIAGNRKGEVKQYKVYWCDRCHGYQMFFTGIIPREGRYRHECPCGFKLDLARVYVPIPAEVPRHA
jgi:hypothetical protein